MDTGCPICKVQDGEMLEVVSPEEMMIAIGRILSGRFKDEEEMLNHIHFAAYLCLDALCAKFGREVTSHFLSICQDIYSSEDAASSTLWNIKDEPVFSEAGGETVH